MADGSGPTGNGVPAKKRSRYTTVACNECKRRKIKCNGEKPCERCGNQNLECVYESPNFQDSDEYRKMTTQIETLQGQVETLFKLVMELRAEQERWGLGGGVGTNVHGEPQGAVIRRREGNGTGVTTRRESPPQRGSGPAGGQVCAPEDVVTLGSGDRALADSMMDVDMSRHDNGRIDFIQPVNTRTTDVEGWDPLLTIGRANAASLLMLYTKQIHVLYPFLDLEEVMQRLHKSDTLSEQLYRGDAGTRTQQLHSSSNALQTVHDPAEMLNDVMALTCKMLLAVAAHAQDPGSRLASSLHSSVQTVYQSQGWPPGWSISQNVGLSMDADGSHFSCQVIVRGIRLRLLHALWEFQHGTETEAFQGAHEALRMHKTAAAQITNNPDASREAAEMLLMVGGNIYSMYWRWAIMLRPAPRYDIILEKVPPRRFEEGDSYDSDGDSFIGLPLFEFAKLCSVTCFAFERPRQELVALETTKPPWSQESAIDHVHRWQGNFSAGLRSLACIRPGFLAGKTPEERTVYSAIYLYAHFLRLSVCRYKRAGAADRYQGPISELYGSVKYGHESITVLWNVHEAGETWAPNLMLYNTFLLNAAGWVYELLQEGIIRLSDEVKVSFQKTLVLMETYCHHWDKAQDFLGKLQESRRYGTLV